MLRFYKEKAYESDEIIFSSKFGSSVVRLSQSENDTLKAHFAKQFNALIKTVNIATVWSASDEGPSIENSNTAHKNNNGRKSVIHCLYNDAFLFLPSNYKSDLDHIEFEIYKGVRRSLHLSKQCWSAKMAKKFTEFSPECQSKVIFHAMKQFNKASEAVAQSLLGNGKFKLQLKFGDVYFTDLPALFLEETSSITLSQMSSALENGHKSFSFKSLQSGKKCLIMEKSKQEDSYKRRNNEHKSKKRKPCENMAYSAFDSNISGEDQFLHAMFIKNEFEAKLSDYYVVHLELTDRLNDKKSKNFRIKYDSKLEMVNIKPLAIKWLNIDIINESNNKSCRDVRLHLISEQLVDLEANVYALDSVLNDLNEKIKSCVFQKACIFRIKSTGIDVSCFLRYL